VTTEKGRVLYLHKSDLTHVLIPPHVAAGMTDLLQTAVNTGTGKNAQIGRPVAGKTGTTSSNKDGWFMGFSSGLTTGVWMGRDDARPVRDLQGGRAPARAFAAFMRIAVAKRPIEQFDTKVTLPESQLEPDEEAYFGDPDTGQFVDEDGNPLPESGGKARSTAPDPPPMDDKWMDEALGRVEQVPEEKP
jgi:penicillin-binding protein 1A